MHDTLTSRDDSGEFFCWPVKHVVERNFIETTSKCSSELKGQRRRFFDPDQAAREFGCQRRAHLAGESGTVAGDPGRFYTNEIRIYARLAAQRVSFSRASLSASTRATGPWLRDIQTNFPTLVMLDFRRPQPWISLKRVLFHATVLRNKVVPFNCECSTLPVAASQAPADLREIRVLSILTRQVDLGGTRLEPLVARYAKLLAWNLQLSWDAASWHLRRTATSTD